MTEGKDEEACEGSEKRCKGKVGKGEEMEVRGGRREQRMKILVGEGRRGS